jgi:flagellin
MELAMTVSSIIPVAPDLIKRTTDASGAKYAASIKSLISGDSSTSSVAVDTVSAGISSAITVQTQISTLRAASLNVAQSSSLVEVASNGARQVGNILVRLEQLATRASAGDLSQASRSSIDVEIQSLKTEINRIATAAKFGGAPVLDGSVTPASVGVDGGSNIADISADALFGNDPLAVDSPEAAKKTLETIQGAKKTLDDAIKNITDISSALEVGASTLESAIQNIDASRSTLSENDLLGGSQKDAKPIILSLSAQTNRLPTNILQLLS